MGNSQAIQACAGISRNLPSLKHTRRKDVAQL